jgi:hypothetical protein
VRLLLALILSCAAAPASAQKFILDRAGDDASAAACRQAVAKYKAASSVALLQPLYACLEHPDPRIRNLTFDKIVQREIWDDPSFPQEIKKLDAAAAKGERDKDPYVSGVASSMRWWLHNYQTYREDQQRAREHATPREQIQQDPEGMRLVFSFGAGVLAQLVVFLLPALGSESPLTLVGAGALGIFGMVPGRHEHHYDLRFHIGFSFIVCAFSIFGFFKRYILPRVSESILLLNGIVFWYLFATVFESTRTQTTLMALAALPTAGSLIVAFTIREWSFAQKLSCYVWFLIVMIGIGLLQLGFGNLAFLLGAPAPGRHPLEMFMTGMGFTYTASCVFYVYILIPLADKNESHAHRMRRWRDDAELMTGRFGDYALSAPEAALILAAQGGLCYLNWRQPFIAPPLLANLSLIFMPRILAPLCARLRPT